MNNSTIDRPVSRRTALAGLGVGSLGVALAAGGHRAAAQESTPDTMAGHPIVGAWIIDRRPDDTADPPTLNVFTADGGIIDPIVGVGGVWQATGPRTLSMTMVGITVETLAGGGAGSYAVIRGTTEVDEAGETATGSSSVTVVAADGTILVTGQGTTRAIRVRIEPQDAMGMPIAGFPAWTPAPPVDATPTA